MDFQVIRPLENLSANPARMRHEPALMLMPDMPEQRALQVETSAAFRTSKPDLAFRCLVLRIDVVVLRIVQPLQPRDAVPLGCSGGSGNRTRISPFPQGRVVGRGRKGGGGWGVSRQVSQHVRPPHKSSVCNREGDTVSVGFRMFLPKLLKDISFILFF